MPSQLIRHTIDNFNIHPDKQAVARINESLATLQQARELRLREAENALKSTSTMATQPFESVLSGRRRLRKCGTHSLPSLPFPSTPLSSIQE